MNQRLQFLLVFGICVLVRFSADLAFEGPGFWGDSYADSCIHPYRLLVGGKTRLDATHTLAHLIYIGGYKLFGFSEQVAKYLNLTLFSAGLALFYLGLSRISSQQVAMLFIVLTNITYPFIFHSIWPLCYSLAVLPFAAVFFLRTLPPSTWGSIGTAIITASTLFIYPGSTICCIALLAAYYLVFFREVKRAEWTTITLSFLVAAAVSVFARQAIANGELNRWGGGVIAFANLTANLKILLSDIFWRSESWDSLNNHFPFLEYPLVPFLLIAIAGCGSSWMAGLVRREERRWGIVLCLAIAFSILIVAPIEPYNGIRRIFPVIFYLYSLAALGIAIFIAPGRYLTVRVAIIFAVMLGISGRAATSPRKNFSLTESGSGYELTHEFINHTSAKYPELKTFILNYSDNLQLFASEKTSAKLGWENYNRGIRVYSLRSCESFGDLTSPFLLLSNEPVDNALLDRFASCAKSPLGSCHVLGKTCTLNGETIYRQQVEVALVSCDNSPMSVDSDSIDLCR